jgi:dihydrofolate synthase/folylpolyglutamate synthase
VSSKLSAASADSATDWVASLSPWPEEFGLDRMRELLDRLGHPERRYPAIHVVGTNGKSTATRTIAALLHAEGRRAGAYTSPHVSGWAERIWVNGAEADFERAVARVRPDASAIGATQFEALTAAALLEFAERQVEVAVVEAGLGGRLDATNVVDAEVVLLTNVSLEHTEVLGDTTEQIASEKLAVAHAARIVVLPDLVCDRTEERRNRDGRRARRRNLPRRVQPIARGPSGRLGTVAAALGRRHLAGTAWLREHRRPVEVVVGDPRRQGHGRHARDRQRLRRALSRQPPTIRALPAERLAVRAAPHFAQVGSSPTHLASPVRGIHTGLILVTGSLYLLANLAKAEEQGVR